MYAIVEIAGQQFKVAKDQKVYVHRLDAKTGSKISFDQVLLLGDGDKVTVGAPAIANASVEAKVVSHLKGDKVIVFKKKRRKGYRVKNGHRQALTELLIENIKASGAKAKKEAVAKPVVVKEKSAVKKAAPKVAVKKEAPKDEVVNLSKMTVAELKAAAKKEGVEGISAMKKADLIAALSK